jgi:hypothetical protein
MPLYLTISEGETADVAQPLLATGDPRIIARVARDLAERCGAHTANHRKVVSLTLQSGEDGKDR